MAGKQKTWGLGMWGILNAEGEPWTPSVFNGEELAQQYLDGQRKYYPQWNLSRHRTAPVSVTVRALKARK